jgi:taurine dioxygenase
MSEAPNLETNPAYAKLVEQARKENMPPPQTNPLGAVAAARFPHAKTRTDRAAAIRTEDDGLLVGHFGTIRYKPVQVGTVELKLEPLQPSIGTVVHGIDLATDLDRNPDMVRFLRQLWLERKVIMFRNQNHLTPLQMKAFANHFGEVQAKYGEKGHEPNAPTVSHTLDVPDVPEMLVLIADENAASAAANWHCDATWQKHPPMGSILMCREAPPIGGDTCFCDCYAMWEGLGKETRDRVEHLSAVHVGAVIHQMDGRTPSSVHPVARTHPETGRTLLYVQQGFVQRFADVHGIAADEQRQLLQEMKKQEGRLEYTCRFRWEPGSIAMWDNRAVLHSASGDFWPHRRRMERVTILDYDLSRRTPYYKPAP